MEKAESLCSRSANISKDSLVSALQKEFALTRKRSVYIGKGFSVRFSKVSGTAFSNTVLGLRALKDRDHEPFVVIIVRVTKVEFFLANSTFIRKISHSSHKLTEETICGSFQGPDIMVSYEGVSNAPQNFSVLFAKHQRIQWESNLARLVAATGGIVGTGKRFYPDTQQKTQLLRAPSRAQNLITTSGYQELKRWFREECNNKKSVILSNAQTGNVNIRGNSIEQAVTGSGNSHNLADLTRMIGSTQLALEIKTKLIGKSSAPAGYNLDKAWEFLSLPNTMLAIGFIGIDPVNRTIETNIVTIFDSTLLSCTGVQKHWSGRNSRGATQFSGPFHSVINQNYREVVSISAAQKFITDHLE